MKKRGRAAPLFLYALRWYIASGDYRRREGCQTLATTIDGFSYAQLQPALDTEPTFTR